ncbi:hydrolase or metal-binding protein, partial [Acinetobacter baumannii]
LQEAIQTAKEIDQKSKLCGFNQAALDQMARQGYGNAQSEVNIEEGLDLVEEFYADEIVKSQQLQSEPESNTSPKFHQGESFVRD